MTRHVNLAVMSLDLGGAGLPSVAIRLGSFRLWAGDEVGRGSIFGQCGALYLSSVRAHTRPST